MEITLEEKNLIIKIPKDMISQNFIKRFIERVELEELVKDFKMTEREAWELSEEIKRSWWEEHGKEILKKIGVEK
ncbi:hypothetical protein [Candidatus Pyrohabitans sp.]